MAYVQFPSIVPQYFADSGDFLAEGIMYAYEAGTTTPAEFYADDTGTSLGVSITLNARGEFPSEVYLDDTASYKFVLKTKDGVQIWERDNVDPPVTADTNTFGWVAEKAGTYVSTTSFTVAGNPVNDAGDAVWQAERRARIYRHTSNDYLYATIQSASYSAALDKTTVTLESITDNAGASATLSDEELTVWVGVYVPGPTNQGGTSLPVDDTTALVRDPTDNTKQVRLDAGAVATGTTRVLSMPDRDVDLSGVIVESGSNANGEYWRWGNGLQVCYFRDTSTALVTSSAAGAVYVSTASTLTFPAAFSGSTDDISVASASIYSGSGGLVWTVTSALTLTTVDIRLYSHANTGSGYPGYFAIGPWS